MIQNSLISYYSDFLGDFQREYTLLFIEFSSSPLEFSESKKKAPPITQPQSMDELNLN